MRYSLRSKAGRSHHIDQFLKRLAVEGAETGYLVIERNDDEGTAIVDITGELPGFPPVLVEALPA
jgi:hypothetical protein